MKRIRLRAFYYGPLLAWMAFIFLMSTGVGEGENSKDLIVRILQVVAPDTLRTFTPDQLYFLNYALRKAGHVTEYFILMALAVRAFQYGRYRLRWQSPVFAMLLCGIYAVSDEYHQYFVSGRSATAGDVVVDVGGALAGLLIILGWFLMKSIERAVWQAVPAESRHEERAENLVEQGAG